MSRVWPILVGLVGLVAFAYVAYGAMLYVMQDAMVFPRPGGISADALDAAAGEVGARPVSITTSDGVTLYGWHRRTSGDKLVIYFHGNAETVADNVALQRLLARDGWDVLSVALRGYPGSEGKPSEAGAVLDAHAMWDFATQTLDMSPSRVVLHGRSLGGGVAAHLAEDRNPAAMVLESTFTSVLDLAGVQAPIYPVRWLVTSPFETIERAPRVGVPTLVLHSRDDQVIPVSHGRALHRAFAEGQYLETDRWGHEHCLPVADPGVRAAYRAFLAEAVAGP